MNNDYHVPVLVESVLHYLLTNHDGIYVDGTLGGGGHAEHLLMNMSANATLIGFDMDIYALSYAQRRLSRFGDKVIYIHDNFANLCNRLHGLGIERINGLLIDLGMSSHQLGDAERGFAFQLDGSLDMRMNQQQTLNGWTVVNTYDQPRLADILWKYGEERNAQRIAKKIIAERSKQSIDSTKQLANIVGAVVGKQFLQKSLARVFQAVRIEVNDELENLRTVLRDSVDCLERGSRIAVIAYHSLEDRIVKEFIKEESRTSSPSGSKLIPDCPRQPRLAAITKKLVRAESEEIALNSRARSAKLRVAERVS
jgi:16S rRNA (cytosine1402-N4)-methyltransferase